MPMSTLDLWSPAARRDPAPLYAQLRAEAPLVQLAGPFDGKPVWLALRYAATQDALRDARLCKDLRRLDPAARARLCTFFQAGDDEVNTSMFARSMLNVDPPDHTRLRSLVSRAFTPRRIAELRGEIAAITAEVLDGLRGRETLDFLDEVAFPIPIRVIAGMLGVPFEDRERFRGWAHAIMLPPLPDLRERRLAAVLEMRAYFDALFARRRGALGDDLVSALLAVEEEGDRLDTDEVFGMVGLLLIAGYETTVNLLASGTLALLQHPEQLARLRAEPQRIDTAVEELLRLAGPVELAPGRVFVEDTVFHGQTIRAGELVLPVVMAANRDPEVFPEPERFDIDRAPNRHLAFGSGIHHCLGAPLARLEAAVAVPMILERLPRLRLAVPAATIAWTSGLPVRGLQRLPVRID